MRKWILIKKSTDFKKCNTMFTTLNEHFNFVQTLLKTFYVLNFKSPTINKKNQKHSIVIVISTHLLRI
jgi:hypothetical protein